MQLKITRLRHYYGGENNKVEKSKTSGGNLDSVYVPAWTFFDSLEFIKDNLVARPTKSNMEDDGRQFITVIIRLLLSLSGRW